MKLGPAEPQLWSRIAEVDVRATFFHTPLWRDLIVGSHVRSRDASISVHFGDGRRGVVPLIERRGRLGLLHVRESGFAGTYGGLIADGPVSTEEEAAVYDGLREWRALHCVVTRPPGAEPAEPPIGFRTQSDSTHLLDPARPLTDLQKVRWAVSKAERSGIGFRRARTLDDYRAYFRIYQDSLARWGVRTTSRYSWPLFERGFHMAGRAPENLCLWLAVRGSEVVAGMWVFYWRERAYWWHSAVLREHMRAQPMDLLMSEVVARAAADGVERFDMMPSGGHEGVVAFKEKFGAEPVPVQRLWGDAPWRRIGYTARRRSAP